VNKQRTTLMPKSLESKQGAVAFKHKALMGHLIICTTRVIAMCSPKSVPIGNW
jgi:hypothetical protein